MRNRISIAALLLLVLSTFSPAQLTMSPKVKAGVEKAVEDVVEDQRLAAINNDVASLEALLADDYVSTNASGETRTKNQTVAFYKQSNLKYEAIIISDLVIRVLSATSAVANFKITTKEYFKGEDTSGQFRVTRVLVKRSGRWLVIANHSTSLTQ